MNILHLHSEDSLKNKQTLICRLSNGTISYILYGGWGSSGTPFSVSNIQLYDRVDGQIKWKGRGASLPIDNLDGETLEAFKARVIAALNNSTFHIVNEVNTNVSFN